MTAFLWACAAVLLVLVGGGCFAVATGKIVFPWWDGEEKGE